MKPSVMPTFHHPPSTRFARIQPYLPNPPLLPPTHPSSPTCPVPLSLPGWQAANRSPLSPTYPSLQPAALPTLHHPPTNPSGQPPAQPALHQPPGRPFTRENSQVSASVLESWQGFANSSQYGQVPARAGEWLRERVTGCEGWRGLTRVDEGRQGPARVSEGPRVPASPRERPQVSLSPSSPYKFFRSREVCFQELGSSGNREVIFPEPESYFFLKQDGKPI